MEIGTHWQHLLQRVRLPAKKEGIWHVTKVHLMVSLLFPKFLEMWYYPIMILILIHLLP